MNENKRKKNGGFLRNLSWGSLTAMVIAVVIAFNAVIFALTSLFGLYIYSPPEEDFSISGNTDVLYKDAMALDKEVTVTFCLAKDELETHATGKYVLKTAEAFAERYEGFIKLKFVNIYTLRDENGERVDMTKYKTDMEGNPTEIFQSSVIFECDGNYKVVTDLYSSAGFADFFSLDNSGTAHAYIGEEIMGSMIAWVLNKNHGKVYLTQNHGETADIALSTQLACAGYNIGFVNLSKEPVPSDADFLIISNPTNDFEKGVPGSSVRTEADRLSDYILDGGSVYVTLDPFGRRLPVLEGLLAEHGITFVGGEVEDGRYVHDVVSGGSSAITPDGLVFVAEAAEGELSGKIGDTLDLYGSGNVLMSYSGRLLLSGGAKPLLVTGSSAVAYRDDVDYNRDGNYVVAAYSECVSKDGDVGRIVVVPSMYLTSSTALIIKEYSNKDFSYAIMSEIFGASCAPHGTNIINYNSQGSLNNLTMGKAWTYTAIIFSIPLIIATVGAVTIIKRKNR